MIDPTREEWRAARDRVWIARGDGLTGQEILRLTEVALGCPCPPEPAPEPFLKGECTLVRVSEGVGTAEGTLWVGIPGNALRPDEADGMALALTECAAYIREQEAKQEPPRNAPLAGPPSCGRVLVGQGSDTWDPLCRRAKGHPGVCCHDGWTPADHARKQATA